MDPSKNYFFGQFLGLSAFFLLFCHDFWFIWGPSGGIFLTCLAGQIFSCFFIDFSKKKKRKMEKHKKYVLTCELQCFVRVAMLEKA